MIWSIFLLSIGGIYIIIHHAFVLPSHERKIFKLYECRDRLALYGMTSLDIQRSFEYKYLMSMINQEIYLMNNNISFTQYFKTSVENSVENQKEVQAFLEKIQKDEIYWQVFTESFSIFEKYFSLKMKWFLRLCLVPANYVLTFFLRILPKTSKRRNGEGHIKRAVSYVEGVSIIWNTFRNCFQVNQC